MKFLQIFQEPDGSSLYGVLNLDTPPSAAQHALSFSNPVYELSNPSGAGDGSIESALIRSSESSTASSAVTATMNHDILSSPTGNAPGTAYKVEHVLSSQSTPNFRSFSRLRDGMDERLKVAKQIFPYMTCIALAYCVTLALYPGLESEIISCNLKSWMPVLLMFTFNTTDVIVSVNFCAHVTFQRLMTFHIFSEISQGKSPRRGPLRMVSKTIDSHVVIASLAHSTSSTLRSSKKKSNHLG